MDYVESPKWQYDVVGTTSKLMLVNFDSSSNFQFDYWVLKELVQFFLLNSKLKNVNNLELKSTSTIQLELELTLKLSLFTFRF